MFQSCSTAVQKILSAKFGVEGSSLRWERPQDADHGDIATPVAMQVAKQTGKNPREIAEALVSALSQVESVEKSEVAGPGYVNVWLTPEALIEALGETRKACVPAVKQSKEKPVVVEYSSPNIAKPLGIHHILTTMIGQVIANLYRHAGFNVITVNHIGDWGTQFGKLYAAWKHWGNGDLKQKTVDELLALYVRFHEEAEKNPVLEDEARSAFRKLEEGDATVRTFWQQVVETSMKEIKIIYQRLHVQIDHDHGESMYEEMMKPILEEGKAKGVFTEGKGGALITEFSEDTHLPPAIVLKGDGGTIYHTRDLATIRYRIDTWHPQVCLYVVGSEQELYFRQLFAIVRKLDWDLPHIEHISFGRMRFADRKMSTRKGNILKLEDVLDEAVERASRVIAEHGDSIQNSDPKELAETMGIGAIVYGVLSQNRRMDILFDWDKFLSFDGNSAPYLQYTHARARSVVEKAGGSPKLPNVDALTSSERLLLNTLLRFERVLEEARASHMPHVLANFLYELCQNYNAFYHAEPILKAEEPQRSLRIYLTDLTASVIRTGAELLTIRVPDRM